MNRKLITTLPAAAVVRQKRLEAQSAAAQEKAYKHQKQWLERVKKTTNVTIGTVLVRERPDYVNAYYRIDDLFIRWSAGTAAVWYRAYYRIDDLFIRWSAGTAAVWYRASTCDRHGRRKSMMGGGVRIYAGDNEYKIHRLAPPTA